jgi:hypothetical protein
MVIEFHLKPNPKVHCTEPDELNPRPHTLILNIHSNIIIQVFSFFQVSRPEFHMHLSRLACVLHALCNIRDILILLLEFLC